MQRDLVRRNVVELTEVPTGRPGRTVEGLHARLADAVLRETAPTDSTRYIVVSMLTGARTEELRALRWDHVHLDGTGARRPPYIEVWRSVRAGGDTKTRRSRRTIALPDRCVEALRGSGAGRRRDRERLGRHGRRPVWSSRAWWAPRWTPPTCAATSAGLSRACRGRPDRVDAEGVAALVRVPAVRRRCAVEEISRLVGHSGTTVTELVYRHQLRPVIQTGAR